MMEKPRKIFGKREALPQQEDAMRKPEDSAKKLQEKRDDTKRLRSLEDSYWERRSFVDAGHGTLEDRRELERLEKEIRAIRERWRLEPFDSARRPE